MRFFSDNMNIWRWQLSNIQGGTHATWSCGLPGVYARNGYSSKLPEFYKLASLHGDDLVMRYLGRASMEKFRKLYVCAVGKADKQCKILFSSFSDAQQETMGQKIAKIRIIIFLASLLLLPVNGMSVESPEPKPFRLHSVRADFRQEKHLQILARPIISDGTFIFQAPGSLRWEYLSPVRSVLLMHEGRMKKFIEQGGRLQEDKTMGFDTMQVVLADIANWLDGRFGDNDMFTVTFPDHRTVLLVPKDKGLAALISAIELKLAEQKGLLDAVTIFEGPQSSTRLIFSERILNQEIPAALFIAP